MELLQALYTELRASTNGVVAYTSNRVYPGIAKQNTKIPYIVNQIIASPPVRTNIKDGCLHRPFVSIAIRSTSYGQCRAIASAVKTAIRDFRGTMGGAGGITVQRSFLEDETEFPEVDPETNIPKFRIIQDYQINYST